MKNQVSATIVPRHKERREVHNLKNQVSQLIAFWKHQNKIACATRALQKQHNYEHIMYALEPLYEQNNLVEAGIISNLQA